MDSEPRYVRKAIEKLSDKPGMMRMDRVYAPPFEKLDRRGEACQPWQIVVARFVFVGEGLWLNVPIALRASAAES